MSHLVLIYHVSIHVLQEADGKFTVHTYVNGKLDAQYGSGTQEWATALAVSLANGDCPRCSGLTTPQARAVLSNTSDAAQ
jgi:hypothetical protein